MTHSAISSTGTGTAQQGRPLVSAIMVTRNQESYIREGLHGLMEQSIADRMEVIVVDAGSEQSEWAVIADLQRRYRNLISLRSSDGTALNLALRIASGRYLTLLEAPDRMKHDAYELLAAALEQNPEAMLAYGDTCITAIPHETFAHHTSYGKMIWPDYTPQQLGHLTRVAPHPLWRRELHDTLGGFSGGEQMGMRDFLQKVAERHRMIHLQEFTGLKLVTAETAQIQTAQIGTAQLQAAQFQAVQQPTAALPAAQAAAAAQAPPAASQPEPAHTAAARPEPAPAAAELSADQAYAAVTPQLAGDDPAETASALERHLAQYPDHAVAHNDLAAVSYRLGEMEQALRHYREAVRLAPEEATYRKNLADLLYVEAGEVDEAIAIYLELHKESPRDIETLLNLGIICSQLGQPAEAESFLQRALEIEPWNEAARERLTELRASQEQEQDQEDEESVEERYHRSEELVHQGDLDGAFRALQGILESYPDFSPAHNDLAVLYYQEGEKEKALAHYEKAAALAPGNSIFQKNLADFYFVEGRDIDGAIAIYLELLRKDPKNVETLMSLGKICTALDRPQEAEAFFGQVTQLEPWNRDARDCLNELRHCANA